MVARPRFSPPQEMPILNLPAGKQMGAAISVTRAPTGDLFVLHQPYAPGVDYGDQRTDEGWLPDVVHLTKDGKYLNSWGGPNYVQVDGESQWPEGREGIECDGDGNIWIFGYWQGDNAVLKFSPEGKLLLRIGRRGRAGNDDDTKFLDRPTSCYHDTKTREVFVSDGYGNHRVIAFNADTGDFTRMWGAYGKKPSSLSEKEGFANPVHKVAIAPDGRMYVCDRIKNRIQEFELTSGGARFLREVVIAPGTQLFGATFDLAFAPDGKHAYVADGSNNRVWTLDRESFAVRGWISVDLASEGEANLPRLHAGLIHRFMIEPNGDLLLACTTGGLQRLKYLGVH
jgi:DNA-binding beta-propeller fold protein YncE